MPNLPFEERKPCRLCNAYNQAYLDAWENQRRDPLANPERLTEALKQKNQHEGTCEVINGSWYKGLWSNAIIVYPEKP